MVHKQMQTRDYLRSFITKANKEAGVTFNASKLNSKEECEKYILNLIKDLKNNSGNNKAYIKEINELKEEIEILNTGNKKLESERAFYITQAEGAKKDMKIYQKFANEYSKNYSNEKDKHDITFKNLIFLSRITIGLILILIIEAISIFTLAWK
nr:MAG TPA: Microtubule integrity protein [Caudoviricetes sp.]